LRIEIETAQSVDSTVAQDPSAKKSGWLPLLVVLFLASYGLMTMLIVEQGRTIDSQRTLIRELFRDSNELAAVKTKAMEAPQSQTATNRAPSAQVKTPLTHVPDPQVPATHNTPSSQVTPQRRAQNQATKQKALPRPTKPASDLADAGRSLISL
jgi:hypothetical protein